MIKKIGQKSRSTQKYLCHLSLNKSLIYESFDRIKTKKVLFSYISRITGQFVN